MAVIVTVLELVRDVVTWCFSSQVRLGVLLVFITVVVWMAVEEVRKNAAEARQNGAEAKAIQEKQAEEARLQLPAKIRNEYEKLCYMIEDAEGDFERAKRQVSGCVNRAGKQYNEKECTQFWDSIEEGLSWFNKMAIAHNEGKEADTLAKKLLSAHGDILQERKNIRYREGKGISAFVSAISLYALIRKGQLMDGFSEIFILRQKYRLSRGDDFLDKMIKGVTDMAKTRFDE
ncbi:MAG TPA: hypothetical protein VLH56_01665 [Dissulfurispiraceae bacterium]|nr:hypothetical protein [Dissulfurispiraceae bacterium]